MKTGDNICFTDDIILVSALGAVNIELIPGRGGMYHHIRGGKEIVLWNLKPRSTCGQYLTSDLIKSFHTKGWLDANPDHPFTKAVEGAKNLQAYQSWVKNSVPYAVFSLGAKRELNAKVGSKDYDDARNNRLRQL